MQKSRLFASVVCLSSLALAACSAGGSPGGNDLGEGSGGSGASGGAGGSIATGGTGGTTPRGGTGGSGGTITIGGMGGSVSGSGGAPMVCLGAMVDSRPVVPTVMILVDNSSSMFEPRAELWDPLYAALMDPTSGAVKQLESKIRFGFASYKGLSQNGQPIAVDEDDPACADIASVPYALDNFAAINTLYSDLGTQWMNGIKWETPTGHAIHRVLPDLVALQADPPGPKYILLVTDGNPNTCRALDPQCGQDFTIKAVQDAQAVGVGTLALGIGDIVSQPNDGCPTSARCGELHLQDIANAGMGLPVEAPKMELRYEACNQATGQMLIASYAPTAPVAENAPYFKSASPELLAPALLELLNSVVSCTLDMDAVVTGNPSNSNVLLNGSPIAFGDTAGGWTLEANHYQVTLQGSACETFKAGNAEVSIEFYCDPETGEPTIEPR